MLVFRLGQFDESELISESNVIIKFKLKAGIMQSNSPQYQVQTLEQGQINQQQQNEQSPGDFQQTTKDNLSHHHNPILYYKQRLLKLQPKDLFLYFFLFFMIYHIGVQFQQIPKDIQNDGNYFHKQNKVSCLKKEQTLLLQVKNIYSHYQDRIYDKEKNMMEYNSLAIQQIKREQMSQSYSVGSYENDNIDQQMREQSILQGNQDEFQELCGNETVDQPLNYEKQQHQQWQQETQLRISYQSFPQKLQSLQSTTLKNQIFKLNLFPYLQPWATSPQQCSTFQKIAYFTLGKLFLDESYLWNSLYDMLDYGGLWKSSGDTLTVATYSKVKADQFSSLQLFIPTIITFQIPYDTIYNENLRFFGIRMRRDLYKNVESKLTTDFLGQLRVQLTGQERQREKPVKRTFYCEELSCAKFYSMVKIQTINKLRLHSLKIQSVFTIGS